MDLLIAADEAVPDKKEVSPDLLRRRCNLNVPWAICIVRVNGQFKIRFIWFKLLKNCFRLDFSYTDKAYSSESCFWCQEDGQSGHTSIPKVDLRVVKVKKGFNLIYLVIPMILTSIVFIWAKGSVPNPKIGHLYREII